MEADTVTFYGEEHDESGIPVPFHRYLIVAEPAPWNPKDSVASVAALTEGSECGVRHVVAENAPPSAAIGKAKGRLGRLAQNKGLQRG